MKPKLTKRSSTYALEGGGFLHIDRLIIPIVIPKTKRARQKKGKLPDAQP